MITDDQLREKEAEVEALFGGGSPWTLEESPDESEERIRRIMSRIHVEALGKESVSFVFKSFGATLDGLAHVLFKAVPGGEPPADEAPPEQKED